MPERRSALAALGRSGQGPAEARVRLSEVAHTGKLVVRGEADDPAFLERAAEAVGFALPTSPCTAASGGETSALWLGPNEWLVVTTPGAEAKLAEALRGALAETPSAVTDVSDSRTVIRLSGPAARDVLAKGCPLDLHSRAFAPGAVKQSLIAHLDVAVHLVADEASDGGPVFEITVLRSYAAYLWRWLVDAGTEYGVAVSANTRM
jgi:sarcosine oxidase subunit gamma